MASAPTEIDPCNESVYPFVLKPRVLCIRCLIQRAFNTISLKNSVMFFVYDIRYISVKMNITSLQIDLSELHDPPPLERT